MQVSSRSGMLANLANLIVPMVLVTAWLPPAVAGVPAPPPPAAPEVVSIYVGQPRGDIAPTMFGIFFEDINFAADGGLYPERIKNRSFEFTEPLSGWSKLSPMETQGELIVRSEGGLNENNPHYLRLRAFGAAPALGISNAGFAGMGIENRADYVLSVYIRKPGVGPRAIRATLTNEQGVVIGKAEVSGFNPWWTRYQVTIHASATTQQARLNLLIDEPGELDIDMVSLYPVNTWRGRANGLRRDLVELLADLKPGFLRFPGGCIVEGRRLDLGYRWKRTLGDVAERRTMVNRWGDELSHRPRADYFQSFGLGFFEYFQLAEDIGASPLPILNCGMACQFNTSETVAIGQLGEYIQDALDLIEFANGPVGSRWGTVRARMGHPAPFNLKMLGVGNEQWGPRYIERYRLFAAALKAKHPEIALVAGAGAADAGAEFEYLWSNLRTLKADIIDEHYYKSPEWFLANAGRYDRYDREGPKVFAGEYAAQTAGVVRPDNRNNWAAAIAEAAFMTGLERNADVVTMAAYAPLLAHVDAWQWTPNLIWFDNLRAFGTPSYYVQRLFANHLGTQILPVAVDGSPDNARNGLYSSASYDQRSGEVIVKLVNTSRSARPVRIALLGASISAPSGRAIVLANGDLRAENSFEQPRRISPVETTIPLAAPEIPIELPANSVTALRIPCRR
jgi:alpha-N-arabinofuranosidase